MSHQNYTLEIVSHHPSFKNKSLKKYYVDGIETVGAWGNEPFEIRFKNNTWQKVQVKVSLDGTDVLTGGKASTDANDNMWLVNGYGTLNLKAWPETNNGGAQFIFTSAEKSVAVHTHGDLSSRGIIAVAVYTEGHVEPVRIQTPVVVHHHHYPVRRRSCFDYDYTICSDTKGVIESCDLSDDSFGSSVGGTYSSDSISLNSAAPAASSNYFNAADSRSLKKSKSLESLVSVGAGQHVDQKISYVPGLIKPVFAETVRVRYLWWDDLVAKLRENNVAEPHPSGFPGDKNHQVMSIGNTPRIGEFTKAAFPRESAPVYSRI